MKVVSVVGARPQFVKLAPIAAALGRAGHEHVIVHTGQHYDANLSDVFFTGLGIPDARRPPRRRLRRRTARRPGAMLAALDPVLETEHPGLGAGLRRHELHHRGDPVRGEACTCRSPTWRPGCAPSTGGCPRSTTGCSPTTPPTCCWPRPRSPCEHLAARAWPSAPVLVGDVMVDVCLQVRDQVLAEPDPIDLPIGPTDQPFLLATLHRADNTDDPQRLAALIDALAALPLPVLLLAHPRLVARAAAARGRAATQGCDARRPPRCPTASWSRPSWPAPG